MTKLTNTQKKELKETAQRIGVGAGTGLVAASCLNSILASLYKTKLSAFVKIL